MTFWEYTSTGCSRGLPTLRPCQDGWQKPDPMHETRRIPHLRRRQTVLGGSASNGQEGKHRTTTAGSDVVQSGRPIFDDFFQHLWPYIGNNTANVVFQMVKRLWLIRIDQ
ncbi:hypothetical protein TNCV_425371 [Trichonephila clavipes]|nr:hypothetical protein TNCV_425371 [Trichonephila clavipes]